MSGRFHRRSPPYGQHFLHDANILSMIVGSAGIGEGDTVLEIGVGTGKLTGAILETGASVIGVEVDASLVPEIGNAFEGEESFRFVRGDVLRMSWDDLLPEDRPVVLMGNLPYAVSTQVIFRILDFRHRISRAVLLVQWEVGARMAAPPGSRTFGRLSVACQLYGKPEIIRKIPPSVFLPPPKVDSALIRWDLFSDPVFPVPDRGFTMEVVKAAFGKRRKKLANSLASGLSGLSKTEFARILADLGLTDSVRAEQLSVEQFALLANRLYGSVGFSGDSSDG